MSRRLTLQKGKKEGLRVKGLEERKLDSGYCRRKEGM